ncbi:hypothetical protein COMNV_01360 [Commensalibacter sp. Nvir]|uniref:phage neck terminator protein n=1 Tax=Commensalibacter sp. Nvir TaxID=3069817 RepID=UPI002D6700BE|nr:hypothetical protein COMNV_01360 [Commensalibacter sp. Nvir]
MSTERSMKSLNHDDAMKLRQADTQLLYEDIERFLRKAVPLSGIPLTILKGQLNRVASPKPPFILLQVVYEKSLSLNETRYTSRYKIMRDYSECAIQMDFYGSDTIASQKMAKSFLVRFNDPWASEQFERYGHAIAPLYCQTITLKGYVTGERQFADRSTLQAYFSLSPEFGVSQDSAINLRMV